MKLGMSTIYMAPDNSLDEVNLIATLLYDVHTSHAEVFNQSALSNTISIVKDRVDEEGISFLTKTLPKLGKLLDRALTEGALTDVRGLRFKTQTESELPIFMGELFSQVFSRSGELLPSPCVQSVRALRQVLYLMYKYELPYSAEQERAVVAQFEETERDLSIVDPFLIEIQEEVATPYESKVREPMLTMTSVARAARRVLSKVFARFDPKDITPCHGPGAVATRQQLWAKYEFVNVSERITPFYPLDAYFCASLGAVCDTYADGFPSGVKSFPARVILVPKDSRGPRLISCEPVDFQWVQGGLRRAIVEHVERHPLTRNSVRFTDQNRNRNAALTGSVDGSLCTLDLKEASDRVSLQLVRLLFPAHICDYLECCRTLSTVLPDGRELELRKFAPMGSSLCFPIMALTIWALLYAAAPDGETRKGLLVYGDDVVVPKDYTHDAIEVLEAFGLMVNAEKSCLSGFFRESCGLDAFKGIEVTPVRFRTVWTSSRSPNVYCSWIAYANSCYDRHYYALYELIVANLHRVYGRIPEDGMHLACPSLRAVEQQWLPRKVRTNYSLQKREWKVWTTKAPRIMHESSGWVMLLRFFTEAASTDSDGPMRLNAAESFIDSTPFCVRSYTRRGTSMLVQRWR